MATTTVEIYSPRPEPEDAFRYGWRYLRREGPDGRETWERVPLTLEDVLHPQEEDVVTQSVTHQLRQEYLHTVLAAQLAHDPTAIVVADLLIDWDVPGLKGHGPDIAVILGVRERKNWSTFHVAEEGVRPALLIEITSPATASLDRSVKVEEYEAAGVETYVLIDTARSRSFPALRLIGYGLTPDGYQLLVPDERGRLWLAVARTWLGIADNEIVCYDEMNRPLGDYVTLATTLRRAEQRAADEAAARLEAEHRAAQAERRADEEARTRAAAEARLRALEDELRRLRGS